MNIVKKKSSSMYMGTFLTLVVMCIILALANKNFLTYVNLMSVLKQAAFNALLSVGMLLCLVTAGIDLSVGANAVFCACVIGAMAKAGLTNGYLMMLVAIIAGGLVGFLNGTLLPRLHLPHPFVSTLGMKNVLWGLALVVSGNQMLNNFPNEVQWLGKTTFKGFPVSFIIVILIFIFMHIFLTRTAMGRSIYCAGGNLEATRLSGIDTAKVLTFCYTLSGVMAALAGILSIGRSGISNGANAIQPYDTDAIAACIIGGASFTGGKGTMTGTMIGCLIIAVLRNGFALLSISSAWQNIVLGLVIILAVLMDVVRAYMDDKKRRLSTVK